MSATYRSVYDRSLEKTPEQLFINSLRKEFELSPAESAAILAKPEQCIFIPDIEAGCYLAHTATRPLVEDAWAALDAALGDAESEVTPITYVNSDAELKAFCGLHDGVACTSGNAEKVLRCSIVKITRCHPRSLPLLVKVLPKQS